MKTNYLVALFTLAFVGPVIAQEEAKSCAVIHDSSTSNDSEKWPAYSVCFSRGRSPTVKNANRQEVELTTELNVFLKSVDNLNYKSGSCTRQPEGAFFDCKINLNYLGSSQEWVFSVEVQEKTTARLITSRHMERFSHRVYLNSAFLVFTSITIKNDIDDLVELPTYNIESIQLYPKN